MWSVRLGVIVRRGWRLLLHVLLDFSTLILVGYIFMGFCYLLVVIVFQFKLENESCDKSV